MNQYFIIIFVSLFVVISSNQEVIEIQGNEFDVEISNHEVVLVLFYSPGCGHCSTLMPEYVKAASVLKRHHPKINLAKIDCTTETGRPVCKEQGVQGFPTMRTYINGKLVFEYDGPRDAGGMVAYMKSKVKPPDVELETTKDYENYVDSLENCVIGFFDTEGSKLEAEFHKLAHSQAGHYRFARTSNERLLKRFGYRNFSDIVVFRSERLSTKLEPDQVRYEGPHRLYDMRNWLVSNYHGLVGYRTTLNRDQFNAPFVVLYLNITDLSDRTSQARYWRNRLMMVSNKFTEGKERVTFAVSDAYEMRRELSDFGLSYESSGDQPIITARDANQKRYTFSSEFSVENVEKFVTNLINGHLTPYIKSQAPPLDPDIVGVAEDTGLVKTLVAKTFISIVNDPNKDVFVMFENPRCGRCRTVEKAWKKVSEKISEEDSIIFTKMNAEENEVHRPYYVKGYPTIFFVPKGLKASPKFYEIPDSRNEKVKIDPCQQGDLEVKSFIKYLAKESTVPLKKYDRNGKKKKDEEKPPKHKKDEL